METPDRNFSNDSDSLQDKSTYHGHVSLTQIIREDSVPEIPSERPPYRILSGNLANGENFESLTVVADSVMIPSLVASLESYFEGHIALKAPSIVYMDEESKTAVKKEEDIFLFVKRPGDIRKARLFMGEVSGSGLILSLVWNTGAIAMCYSGASDTLSCGAALFLFRHYVETAFSRIVLGETGEIVKSIRQLLLEDKNMWGPLQYGIGFLSREISRTGNIIGVSVIN